MTALARQLGLLLSLVSALALGLYAGRWLNILASSPAWKQLPAGALSPEPSLQSLDGAPFAFPQGRQVFLLFFSTTCPWSESELPAVAAFAASHPEVDVIAVNFGDESPAHIAQYVAAHAIPYAVVRDPGGQTAKTFGVLSTPSSFVIEPDSRIRHSRRGGGPGISVEQIELWTNLPVPPTPILGWLSGVVR